MTQARVLRNDARILDAGLEAAATEGWSGLSLATVARRAGLSQRPVATRFADRSALATMVWGERIAPALVDDLHELLSTAGLLSEPVSAEGFQLAMTRFARPGTELLAAAELLIMATFDQGLADAVARTIGVRVRDWCRPHPGRVTRAQAARRAYVLILALGLLAVARRPGTERVDLTGVLANLLLALGAAATPQRLPAAHLAHLAHLSGEIPFDTGDPITDALLASTLRLVGTDGYESASTARIARDAQVAEANIFVRYPSKLRLFIDASTRHQAYGFAANADFQQRLEAEHGLGIAEAVQIREMMDAGLRLQRAIQLEELRVSWHDEGLLRQQEEQFTAFVTQQAAANPDWTATSSAAIVHLGLATGIGLSLLASLDPEAASLPYDVVTVPLYSQGLPDGGASP